MSLCHICPHSVMKINPETGAVEYSEEYQQIIDSHPDPFSVLPCSSCELGSLSGTNYNKGADKVSIDSSVLQLEAPEESFEETCVEDEKYFENIISGVISISRMLRALPDITRDLVEFRLENPNGPLKIIADKHSISPQAAHHRLKKAIAENPDLKKCMVVENRKRSEEVTTDDDMDALMYTDIDCEELRRNASDILWKHAESYVGQRYKKVLKAFPRGKREPCLSFQIHLEIATKCDKKADRDFWIDSCAFFQWDLKTLRKKFKEASM